jgi:hypothetical protein
MILPVFLLSGASTTVGPRAEPKKLLLGCTLVLMMYNYVKVVLLSQ